MYMYYSSRFVCQKKRMSNLLAIEYNVVRHHLIYFVSLFLFIHLSLCHSLFLLTSYFIFLFVFFVLVCFALF